MRTVSDIFDVLGGAAAIARATGIPFTTVASWKASNFVPEWRQAALLEMPEAEKARLKASDFPPKSHRIARTERAA